MNYMSNRKATIIFLTVWIDKKDIIIWIMSYFPEPVVKK